MKEGRMARARALLLLLSALRITRTFETPTAGFLPGHHGYLSSMALAMGKNLDAEHHFLMFTRKSIDAEGKEQLDPHNRFPILSFALIGASVSWFADDPGGEMRVGRIVMLLFFWGTLVLSYRLILRLSGNPLLAAAVSLLAFSSYYMHYYDDMVFNDIPALFGFVLVLLGIAAAEIDGSHGLLWTAAFVSIALGWQGFAPLLCWWLLQSFRSLRACGFHLLNEKLAVHQSVGDLPSLRSIKFRLGLEGGETAFPEYLKLRWRNFLTLQARRVMKATIPTRTLHGALNALSENSGAREGYRLLLVAAVAGAITLYFEIGRAHV